jgi:hypothetical protein
MAAIDTLIKIIVAIIVVAIIAAIFSKSSQSAQMIKLAGTAFNSLVKQVVSPITGSTGTATSGVTTGLGLGSNGAVSLPATPNLGTNLFNFQ